MTLLHIYVYSSFGSIITHFIWFRFIDRWSWGEFKDECSSCRLYIAGLFLVYTFMPILNTYQFIFNIYRIVKSQLPGDDKDCDYE